MIVRYAGGLVFGLVFGLTSLACGDPGVTACIARCQTFTVDPTVCQTMCTRTCPELRASFGVDEDTCRRIQAGTVDRATATPPAELPPAAPTSDLTARCADFVAFAFSCGIGRPPPDPTVDIGVQRSNEIVLQSSVTAQCERREPPYDEALLRCFESSAPDCARYKTCADAAVSARAPGP